MGRVSVTELQPLSSVPGYRADMLGHNSQHFLSSEEGKEKGGFCLACLFVLRRLFNCHVWLLYLT